MKISGFILVIDSCLLRLGVAALLNRIQGVRVMKEFGTNESFVAYLDNHSVDFIIIDQSGFERWIDLYMSSPALLDKTILLEENQKDNSRDSGPVQNVHASIRLTEEKEILISKIRDLLDQQEQASVESPSLQLSPRETTIVRLVAMGLTNRQIAEKLFLSAHTVMTHRKNINSKLGIKSVSGLTVYAIVNNIITIEEVSSLPSR